LLEHAQIGQEGYVGDAQIGGNNGLVVYANERHEIFHSSYADFVFFAFFSEYLRE
jgi:hypothetical protein